VAESNSSPNAAYMKAVKEYDRAVATQNAAMLRDQVLPAFRQAAQSGGVRAKEARHYADFDSRGTEEIGTRPVNCAFRPQRVWRLFTSTTPGTRHRQKLAR